MNQPVEFRFFLSDTNTAQVVMNAQRHYGVSCLFISDSTGNNPTLMVITTDVMSEGLGYKALDIANLFGSWVGRTATGGRQMATVLLPRADSAAFIQSKWQTFEPTTDIRHMAKAPLQDNIRFA
jgi:hypothetical protein